MRENIYPNFVADGPPAVNPPLAAWNNTVNFSNQDKKLFIEFCEVKRDTNGNYIQGLQSHYFYSQHHDLGTHNSNNKYRFSQNPFNGEALSTILNYVYTSPIKNVDPTLATPPQNDAGPIFQKLNFIKVVFDDNTIVYNNSKELVSNNNAPMSQNNMTDQLINLIVHQLVQYDMAKTAIAFIKEDKVTKLSVTGNNTLTSYANYYANTIKHNEHDNVYSQCILKNGGLIFAAAKISPSDSMIRMEYCNNKTFAAMSNLSMALAISRPDRKLSNNDSIMYFALKNMTGTVGNNPENDFFHTYCTSRSNKILDIDLEDKNNFNNNPPSEDGECDKQPFGGIGAFSVNNNQIYLNCGNGNLLKMYLKNAGSGNFTTYSRNKYYKNSSKYYDVTLDQMLNTPFTNDYYEVKSSYGQKPIAKFEGAGMKEHFNNLMLYVCTLNINPLESNIDLIDKIFEV
jgi:hypothetical protein